MSLPTPDELRRSAALAKNRAAALDGLARAGESPAALAKALVALDGLEADDPTLGDRVRAWLEEEREGRAERLSSGLREGCARDGLTLAVVGRDPLELRLPPVAVQVDLAGGKARVLFARELLGTCDAGPDAILAERVAAVAELEAGDWDAPAYVALLHRAWLRAGGELRGDWVELTEVHPEMAWLRQSAAFRLDPVASRYAAYPRARFAYDLWRLRRDRCLAAGGWRLSLGPATGSSTKDKKRVFWLEDDEGRGQYHLTLRFVREEASLV